MSNGENLNQRNMMIKTTSVNAAKRETRKNGWTTTFDFKPLLFLCFADLSYFGFRMAAF